MVSDGEPKVKEQTPGRSRVMTQQPHNALMHLGSNRSTISDDITNYFLWIAGALDESNGCTTLHTTRLIVEAMPRTEADSRLGQKVVRDGHGKPMYRSGWVVDL
jgi:hypothetical protein